MKIQSVKDIPRSKNWRTILYSKPGVGKTTSIKNLPGKTLVLALDNSTKVLSGQPNIDFVDFDRTKPEEEMADFLRDLPNVSGKYQNLVIDNVSSFEKDWFVEQGRKSHNGISNEIQDYGAWTNYFNRVMTQIYKFDGNVLVTAWEKIRNVILDSGQSISQYAPELRDSVLDNLMGLSDVVGRIAVNAKTGNRGVFLQVSDSLYAKNRLDNRKASPIKELYKVGDH